MKRTPVILLMFLISLVVISAFVGADNSDNDPWERRGDGPMSVISPNPAREFDKNPSGNFLKLPFHANDVKFLEDNIEKSEIISLRLNDTVRRMKAEGNDVEKLEKLLEEYNLLVEDSKMYLEMANVPDNVTQADITGSESKYSEEEQKYLEESRKSIIRANLLLRDIFHEFRPYLAPHVRIPDNGNLSAEGKGTVILSGDLDVEISLSEGRISYVDFENDLSIEAEETTEPEIIRMPDMKREIVSYENLNGNITLSGSGFIMELTGENISLDATGTGKAELFGNGTYFIGNDSIPGKKHIWVSPLFENN
ncbi:hypothetical protein V7O62_07180 [Methanolobus sp. ZRKC2]|uniref:hypothetical protein n=1 Tax=Methanolobus sp. ZRKC2 TaxID=3125783 RepID=UPI00324DE881